MTKSWLVVFDSEVCPHKWVFRKDESRCMISLYASGPCSEDTCPHFHPDCKSPGRDKGAPEPDVGSG